MVPLFLTPALDGGVFLVSRSGLAMPGIEIRPSSPTLYRLIYPVYMCVTL
jgi:hypothetical protein